MHAGDIDVRNVGVTNPRAGSYTAMHAHACCAYIIFSVFATFYDCFVLLLLLVQVSSNRLIAGSISIWEFHSSWLNVRLLDTDLHSVQLSSFFPFVTSERLIARDWPLWPVHAQYPLVGALQLLSTCWYSSPISAINYRLWLRGENKAARCWYRFPAHARGA